MNEINKFYNIYGSREWNRLIKNPVALMTLSQHLKFMEPYIHKGCNILDAGCGNGRFAIEMASKGANLSILDISDEQIKLAEIKIREANLEKQVNHSYTTSITNLEMIESETYDVVVCYGGVLNYTLQESKKALAELKRVLKKGGVLLISVISLYGGLFRYILSNPDSLEMQFFARNNFSEWEKVLKTGDLPKIENHPQRHFFKAGEIEGEIIHAGFKDIEMACSPCLINNTSSKLFEEQPDSTFKNKLEAIEDFLFRKREMLDHGQFILLKCKK
jgi:ubiquinone/menaquinone biosynthesis C-methylase UbiE